MGGQPLGLMTGVTFMADVRVTTTLGCGANHEVVDLNLRKSEFDSMEDGQPAGTRGAMSICISYVVLTRRRYECYEH